MLEVTGEGFYSAVKTTGQSMQSLVEFVISREIISNIAYDYQIYNSPLKKS